MKPSAIATVFAVLGTLALNSSRSQADPITQRFDYNVWGVVGAQTGTGVGGIDFMGAPDYTGNWGIFGAQVSAPGSFPLGRFYASPLPDGASITYKDLPFYLHLDIAPAGVYPAQGGHITIDGLLNGTVSGPTSSTVVATITSVTGTGQLPFPLEDLKIDAPQVLSTTQGTLLNAEIVALPAPVPEPSALLVAFAIAVGPLARTTLRHSGLAMLRSGRK